MTTRASSKSAAEGGMPANAPLVIRSYSNGRFIDVLESWLADAHAGDVLEKCEIHSGQRADVGEIALGDDDVGLAPEADIGRLLGDESLGLVVQQAPPAIVGGGGGLVQQ